MLLKTLFSFQREKQFLTFVFRLLTSCMCIQSYTLKLIFQMIRTYPQLVSPKQIFVYTFKALYGDFLSK